MNRIGLLAVGIALLWGTAAHAADTVYYIHTDALGSPVAMTDANRNVVERTQYAPYGQVLNRPEHDGPGYTGHEEDSATGLTNMQQRYDDKVVGRFLSVDPVQPDGSTGASFNRYAYANDNPYKFMDPDGRQDCVSSGCKDNEEKPTSPVTGCLTSGCNSSANVSVTVVDDSYRRGGTSTGATSGAQGNQRSGNSAGNFGVEASGQSSGESNETGKALSGWVNGLYYCQPNCIQPGPALDAESNRISNSYWPFFFGPPAAGAVIGTFPTVGPVVGSAAVRYGPRAIMAGCIALACKSGDLPDKYAEDRVMLQKIYEEAKEVGGDLYKQVLESDNGH